MSALVPSTTGDVERRLDSAAAERMGAAPVDLPESAWDPDRVPREFLPVLAWALSVDLWDPDWPEAVQREVIRQAFALHREHGTPAALKRILDSIGAIYDYTEPEGAPFTATIDIYNSDALLIGALTGLRARIDHAKRASVKVTINATAGTCAMLPIATGHAGAVVAEFHLPLV